MNLITLNLRTLKIIGVLRVVETGQTQPQGSNGCNASNAETWPIKTAQMGMLLMCVNSVNEVIYFFFLFPKHIFHFAFCNNLPRIWGKLYTKSFCITFCYFSEIKKLIIFLFIVFGNIHDKLSMVEFHWSYLLLILLQRQKH